MMLLPQLTFEVTGSSVYTVVPRMSISGRQGNFRYVRSRHSAC